MDPGVEKYRETRGGHHQGKWAGRTAPKAAPGAEKSAFKRTSRQRAELAVLIRTFALNPA